MNSSIPPIKDEAEARAMMAVLGKAEGEFLLSLTAPLFWVIRQGPKQYQVRNGSAFFVDAGYGPFGVTAFHVIKGWREARAAGNVVAFQLSGMPIDMDKALIAADDGLDIATFRISEKEVKAIGKTVLKGHQQEWPPKPPQQERGVYYGGFPGVGTLWVAPDEISFGASTGGGVASSISETDVCSLMDRQNLIATLGEGIPPENYDFGGMSGGPMLMVTEDKFRLWALAGVIYQGPNTSTDPGEAITGLEIIRARRAHFILPDGTLDMHRWNSIESLRLANKRR